MDQKVNVYSYKTGHPIDEISLPRVFEYPFRTDLLKFVHQSISKNKRQSYAVNPLSGTKTSAQSWGPGRAVARVPRVPGSGTHRSGQGAVTNMCRGGRIFGPTTVWRKWHHKINKNQRTQALLVAIAASGVPSIVSARGHRIDDVPEIPLVLESSWESLSKTKETVNTLQMFGIYKQILLKKKKKINSGKGKMRNRRFKTGLGPLVIYEKSAKFVRNIPLIQFCSINHLNLLKLAPGGHIGRFIIWTFSSFSKLENLFFSHEFKKRKKRNLMKLEPEYNIVINSQNVQHNIRPRSKILAKI
jgi:large subunit ribosomal protein L4e